jgi:hypothetical protein
MSWSRRFDEPIPLPRGRQLITLKDAANYIQKLPKAEQDLEEWQAAVEALLLVVELNGPTMMARIGMLRALNRNVQREFDTSREDTHWGRRKLKRVTNDTGNGRTKTPFQGGPLQRGHLPNGNLRRDEACRRNLARARLDKIATRQISQATANDSLVEISA